MLCIDGLLYGFRHFLRSGRTRRPVGSNLIDGHLEFFVDFLDHLNYGPGSTPGIRHTFESWQAKIHPPDQGKKGTGSLSSRSSKHGWFTPPRPSSALRSQSTALL